MIGKSEKAECDDNESATRVGVISEKRKSLQETSAKVQEEVRLCFEQLARVLRTREKQLLRQVQAVHNQQLTIVQSNWDRPPSVPSVRVNLGRQQELQDSILNFGELVASDRSGVVVSDAEPYKIEEYVEADKDHISFDKSIKIHGDDEEETGVSRLETFPESPGELSFNTSSEADATLDHEITVLMNRNYSSSSDGLRETRDSPESPIADTENDENRSDSKVTSGDSPKKNNTADNFSSRSGKIAGLESNGTEKVERINGGCAVPERREETIAARSDFFGDEDDRDSPANEKIDASPAATPENRAATSRKSRESERHPKQIQQWLRQILVETETEPTIHEVEQFAEISKSRFKEFHVPLET